jgi:hypothetical protein
MRKSKKTPKNKTSHRMRRGGANAQSNPILYGIVVDLANLKARYYVESFIVMPNIGYIPFYTSSQNPNMIIQVSFSPYRMGAAAAVMTPCPVAIIDHDVSDDPVPNARLSEIKYLYSSLDDANTALRQLMDPIAVRAISHPNKSVSNRAKTLLQSTSLTSQQRMDALAQGGNDVLLNRLMEGMPNPSKTLMNRAKISMLRSSPPNGGSRRHKRK